MLIAYTRYFMNDENMKRTHPLGLHLKKRICSEIEQIRSFKSSPLYPEYIGVVAINDLQILDVLNHTIFGSKSEFAYVVIKIFHDSY